MRLHFAGLVAGLELWLAFSIIELYLGAAGSLQVDDIIWLAILLGGWGLILG